MGSNDLCGIESAAILMLSLDEASSSKVINYLSPNEIFSLSTAMVKLNNISKETVVSVMNKFCDQITDHTGLSLGIEEYLPGLLVKAVGKEKADIIMERIFIRNKNKGLDVLRWMDSKTVSEIIIQEHPQIIAIILSLLDSDQSSDILQNLPENYRIDVIMRIASLDTIQPSAIDDLSHIIEEQIASQNRVSLKTININGIQKAANIIAYVSNNLDRNILNDIADKDTDMAEKLQDAMFTFEDLVNFNDKDIQTILREISSESLVLALKGSDEKLKNKIFSNLSKRAGSMLQEDLDSRGPVGLKEIDAAKKEILSVVKILVNAGDITKGEPNVNGYA
jgi:flagellar motor switch protein FliG